MARRGRFVAGSVELRDAILEHAAAWRRIAHSTAPADRATAEAAIRELFADEHWPPPQIEWAASPREAAVALQRSVPDVSNPYHRRVDYVHPWLASTLPATLDGPGRLPTRWIRRLLDRLDAVMPPNLVSGPGSTAERLVRGARATGLLPEVRSIADTLVADAADAVRAGPRERLVRDSVRLGQFDGFTPYLALATQALGLSGRRSPIDAARLERFLELRLAIARSAGPWWTYGLRVVVSERPLALTTDARGRLHGESRAAIAYPDLRPLHAWHGVIVPAWVVEEPERITVQSIDQTQNLEVRRVMAERFGAERLIREGGGRLKHEDETGRLWVRGLIRSQWEAMRGRIEPVYMVEVLNSTPELDGSRKTYFLRVPPTMQTAREAVAWTFGLTPEDYAPAVES